MSIFGKISKPNYGSLTLNDGTDDLWSEINNFDFDQLGKDAFNKVVDVGKDKIIEYGSDIVSKNLESARNQLNPQNTTNPPKEEEMIVLPTLPPSTTVFGEENKQTALPTVPKVETTEAKKEGMSSNMLTMLAGVTVGGVTYLATKSLLSTVIGAVIVGGITYKLTTDNKEKK